MVLHILNLAAAFTPVVVSTFFFHFITRKSRSRKPTTYLSYDEGLNLIRQFLIYVSYKTIEDLQHFTAQRIPHPYWVKVNPEVIPENYLKLAAESINNQLGPDGIEKIGGRTWWQWRKPGSENLNAEWIEICDHYNARKEGKGKGNRIMFYVHGGAYFFGSVDEHRYQLQRHARLLKARVFAPQYRLAPQFPFPCGLQDCLSAYLFLISNHDPSTILLAGDSAGGGMVLSMMVVMRDQNIPLPAGAILISPWVDLTHSFPSVSAENPNDYIPSCGFHHKPSESWPPPVIEDIAGTESKKTIGLNQKLSVMIDGKVVEILDQIHMYTSNQLLWHPLVSPVMQPSLGGLPPLLILVGGGEMLRDEQIYIAHKAARPAKYPPRDNFHDENGSKNPGWKPTQVQLQVWDDLCHVATTLSFARPGKNMFISIAQFSLWALAKAQNLELEEFVDDESSSINSKSESESCFAGDKKPSIKDNANSTGHVGRVGDDLPPFEDNMIRQRVDFNGNIFPLGPESELAACRMNPSEIGVIKEIPARKWLEKRRELDNKFSTSKLKIQKKLREEIILEYQAKWQNENPPLTAMVSRSNSSKFSKKAARTKALAMSLWTRIGSSHDSNKILGTKMAGTKKTK